MSCFLSVYRLLIQKSLSNVFVITDTKLLFINLIFTLYGSIDGYTCERCNNKGDKRYHVEKNKHTDGVEERSDPGGERVKDPSSRRNQRSTYTHAKWRLQDGSFASL